MKGKIGTPCSISYRTPRLPKKTFKLLLSLNLSDKAKIKLKAINLYESSKYTIERICEIFEIDRSTFYRWRKAYNKKQIYSLEDKPKRPMELELELTRFR